MSRYLALDVGGRRIGLAVSDPSGIIASPLTVIHRTSKTEDFARIANLVREQDARVLVVGHPLDREGRRGPQARRIERFVEALLESLGAEGLELPVEYWDESLSSRRAQEVMIASGRKAADRRAREDAVAAAVILQDFLESGRAAGLGEDRRADHRGWTARTGEDGP